MRWVTGRLTHRLAWPLYFSRRLRLTRNVASCVRLYKDFASSIFAGCRPMKSSYCISWKCLPGLPAPDKWVVLIWIKLHFWVFSPQYSKLRDWENIELKASHGLECGLVTSSMFFGLRWQTSVNSSSQVGHTLFKKILFNTPWAIKRSQLIFVSNFVKNHQILTQFSVLAVTVWTYPAHLINVATLPCERRKTQIVIVCDITKENYIKCII